MMGWKNIWLIRFYLYLFLNTTLLYIPNVLLRRKNRYIFILKRLGVGDDIIVTSMLEHYSRKGKVYLIYQSYPEVFENLNLKKYFLKRNFFNNQLISFLRTSTHSNIIGSSNGNSSEQNYLIYPEVREGRLFLRDVLFLSRKDVLNELKIVPKDARIIFSNSEKIKMGKKWDYLIKEKIGLVISEPLKKPGCSAKDWGADKVQKVIDLTKDKIYWVQVGSTADKKLEGCVDLRDKTSLRELFYLCSKSRLVFTTEGLLTHLSSAFNVPCYTIYSGFHYPEISRYKNIIPIEPSPLPDCSYCWESPCKLYEKPKCLENISIKEVVRKINEH